MKKKIVSGVLAGMLCAVSVAGCGSTATSTSSVSESSQTENSVSETPVSSVSEESVTSSSETSGTSYNFAANIWGSGAYPLDIIVHADQVVADIAGVNLDVADNQFTADKIISDLQSQLATNPDGVIMFSVVDSVLGNVQQLCDAQNVPYVLDTNFPSDEDTWQSIKDDPLFIGGVAASPYDMGYELGERAAADGNTTAIILAAAVGDYSHDNRIQGFTDAFEAAGGEITQVMHCSDPSEATTKANDLITANPDVDCAYASGGDYLSALAAIKDGDSSVTMKLYGTDIAPDLIDFVDTGVIEAMNGGNFINGAIAECLLINYLDGHQILGEDGKAPVLDYLKCYLVDSSNVEHFQKLYANDSCFVLEDDWKSLMWRFNPDVSLQTYDDFLNNYGQNVYDYPED